MGDKLFLTQKKNKDKILKVLLLSQITFAEKFEKIYVTIYYRQTMMLIIEFSTEDESTNYVKDLNIRVEKFKKKIKIEKKDRTNISNEIEDKKLLNDLFVFNGKLKYTFRFAPMISDQKKCYEPNATVFEFTDILPVPLDYLVYLEKKRHIEKGQAFDEEAFRENPFGRKAKFENNRKKIRKKEKRTIKRNNSSDMLREYTYADLPKDKEKINVFLSHYLPPT